MTGVPRQLEFRLFAVFIMMFRKVLPPSFAAVPRRIHIYEWPIRFSLGRYVILNFEPSFRLHRFYEKPKDVPRHVSRVPIALLLLLSQCRSGASPMGICSREGKKPPFIYIEAFTPDFFRVPARLHWTCCFSGRPWWFLSERRMTPTEC